MRTMEEKGDSSINPQKLVCGGKYVVCFSLFDLIIPFETVE